MCNIDFDTKVKNSDELIWNFSYDCTLKITTTDLRKCKQKIDHSYHSDLIQNVLGKNVLVIHML
jgi:hypothetical protein